MRQLSIGDLARPRLRPDLGSHLFRAANDASQDDLSHVAVDDSPTQATSDHVVIHVVTDTEAVVVCAACQTRIVAGYEAATLKKGEAVYHAEHLCCDACLVREEKRKKWGRNGTGS